MTPSLLRRYREWRAPSFYGSDANRYHIPASSALAFARAEERAEDAGLACIFEDDDQLWDGDCPSPRYVLCAVVYRPDEYRRKGRRDVLACLGGIGVDTMRDPYLRECAAELYSEALDTLDAERDADATEQASELAARATYATVQS